MDIKELKSRIEQRTLTDELLILQYTDVSFLAHQYIFEISKLKNLDVEIIDDLGAIVSVSNDIFGVKETCSTLKLYVCDNFTHLDNNLVKESNIIVICKTVDNETASIYSNYIVSIPKLEQWQIKDYLYSSFESVDRDKLDFLLQLCNFDVYTVDQEIKKLSCFSDQEINAYFDNFIYGGIFQNNTAASIFDLTNAIIKRDYQKLLQVYKLIDNMDIDVYYLLSILIKNFKNIIMIQLSQSPTAEKCGLTQKQFYAIKYNCGIYSKEQLINIFSFLTSIDKNIKLGNLQMPSLIDYIIFNILLF